MPSRDNRATDTRRSIRTERGIDADSDADDTSGTLTDEQKAQANAGVNPEDVEGLFEIADMQPALPSILSETVPGGAYRHPNGSWHDAEGKPLEADVVQKMAVHVKQRNAAAKQIDDSIKANLAEQARNRGLV